MAAISERIFLPSNLAFAAKRRLLVVVESEPSSSELLSKHAVLFAKVSDHLELTLVHPSGNGDQDEPERIKGSEHFG